MENSFSSTKKQHMNEKGAFVQVAQPSAFAYISSSSTEPKLRWDVFINHRGPDVKHTLATAIYQKLSSMGAQVFLDEKALEPGDSIPTEIEEAMDNASLHIAIFSERYAESPWCLAELSYMIKTGVTIIPIFYHVDPSHLRWVDKGGIYAGSFVQHQTKGRYTAEKLEEWKEALQTVSYIDGYLLNNDEWGWVLEGLANRVQRAMSKGQVEGPTNALGLEERVGQIEEIIQGVESVHIVGIVGMGGCGKTTLAKELFKRKSSSISRCSFLYDVRDAASKNQCGLQKKLLKNLRVKCPQYESIDEGKDLLAYHLKSLRALIVLDNVDCTEQIDSLLPAKESLGSGSLIIITTRDAEVLTSWGISERFIYRMRRMSSCHAKKLFCSHAFQKSDPPDGFEELVERALQSCQGLPLSLKVFGAQLCSKPTDYWESQLNEISRVLPKRISNILKISYDALDPEEQERFLDVACFFIGEIKSLALQLWDGLGRSGVYSWETLQNKCLVELDEENRIRMHDHLRDLGREIANNKLPYRIWFDNQINIIQTQAKERMQVRGIMAATTSFFGNVFVNCSSHYPAPFEECVEVMGSSNPKDVFSLKYLVFNYEHFNAKIGELSRGLVWLRCFNFTHANLSSCLPLGSLRVLELYDVEHLETIWENNANAPLQLRELIIHSRGSGSNFQGFPSSIERLKYLKKIVVHSGHSSMTSLPNEFCNLFSLEHLELRNFRELSSLPISFGNLRNLKYFHLGQCRINTLPVSFKQLTNLRHLAFNGCEELTFKSENSSILQNMTKLEFVGILDCRLEILPRHIANQPSLRRLMCRGSQLRNLPANIGQLKKLEVIWIESPFLTTLPDSFSNLISLKELDIYSCQNLRSLPVTFGDLSSLRKFYIYDCPNLKSLPATVGGLHALEKLKIQMSGVESLPETFGQLDNLFKLQINDCPLRELVFGSKTSLAKLRKIDIYRTHLSRISISEDCCPSLETLYLWNNKCLTGIETLPQTVKRLKLILSPEVDALSFGHLTGLKELEFEVSHKVEKVEGLEYLRSLETLKAHGEWEVPAIQTLEHMQGLKRLELKSNNFAALEPCIRTIQKLPSEMKVLARVTEMDGVESIVNNIPFTKLDIIDSFTHEDDEWTLTRPDMQLSGAAVVCFVIECRSEPSYIYIHDRKGVGTVVCQAWLTSTAKQRHCESETTQAERWIWISVCDFSAIANEYHIYKEERSVIIKRGTLAVGEKECVREVFSELVVLLKG